jgi:hypothetical protein
VIVPGPTGTTSVTGRDGHLSCACTPVLHSGKAAASNAAIVMGNARRVPTTTILPRSLLLDFVRCDYSSG